MTMVKELHGHYDCCTILIFCPDDGRNNPQASIVVDTSQRQENVIQASKRFSHVSLLL